MKVGPISVGKDFFSSHTIIVWEMTMLVLSCWTRTTVRVVSRAVLNNQHGWLESVSTEGAMWCSQRCVNWCDQFTVHTCAAAVQSVTTCLCAQAEKTRRWKADSCVYTAAFYHVHNDIHWKAPTLCIWQPCLRNVHHCYDYICIRTGTGYWTKTESINYNTTLCDITRIFVISHKLYAWRRKEYIEKIRMNILA